MKLHENNKKRKHIDEWIMTNNLIDLFSKFTIQCTEEVIKRRKIEEIE